MTLNLLFLSRIHCQFSTSIQYVLIICFANLLWIHYLLREFTRDPLICCVMTLNLLFLSRIHCQFIIFVANPLSIHYLFREFSMDPLIFSRIHFEFTISIAYTRWIHYLIRQFATLSVSRSIHYFFFANSLFIHFFSWDHYGSFICVVNSLFISARSMTKLLRDSWTITKTITI